MRLEPVTGAPRSLRLKPACEIDFGRPIKVCSTQQRRNAELAAPTPTTTTMAACILSAGLSCPQQTTHNPVVVAQSDMCAHAASTRSTRSHWKISLRHPLKVHTICNASQINHFYASTFWALPRQFLFYSMETFYERRDFFEILLYPRCVIPVEVFSSTFTQLLRIGGV